MSTLKRNNAQISSISIQIELAVYDCKKVIHLVLSWQKLGVIEGMSYTKPVSDGHWRPPHILSYHTRNMSYIDLLVVVMRMRIWKH